MEMSVKFRPYNYSIPILNNHQSGHKLNTTKKLSAMQYRFMFNIEYNLSPKKQTTQ